MEAVTRAAALDAQANPAAKEPTVSQWHRPIVAAHMSRNVVTVRPDDPLAIAEHAMLVHRVRHVVVCDGERVVGVLTQRDVYYAHARRELEGAVVRVVDAMTPFVHTVRPDALVEDVARDLADAKYGAAVVAVGDKPVGVFTTVDAMRILADMLAEQRRTSSTQRLPAAAKVMP